MDAEKTEQVRGLLVANRTFGEIERDERLPLHQVAWCAWLRNEPVDSVVRLFLRMVAEVSAPYGKNGLAWLRRRGVAVAGDPVRIRWGQPGRNRRRKNRRMARRAREA